MHPKIGPSGIKIKTNTSHEIYLLYAKFVFVITPERIMHNKRNIATLKKFDCHVIKFTIFAGFAAYLKLSVVCPEV